MYKMLVSMTSYSGCTPSLSCTDQNSIASLATNPGHAFHAYCGLNGLVEREREDDVGHTARRGWVGPSLWIRPCICITVADSRKPSGTEYV